MNDARLNFALADLAVLERDASGLREYAPRALETAERDGHTLYQAGAHRALGVLHRLEGNYTMAEDHLQRAYEGFQALETHWQLGRTLAELGELATARAETERARDHYERALQSFDGLGAALDIAKTKVAIEALR